MSKRIIIPTPSIVSEILLPFFKRLTTHEYEIQVQLSEVYLIHGSKEDDRFWLNYDSLIPMVRHRWLISLLMVNPEEAIVSSSIYQLKNALHQINCHSREQLEKLIQTLILKGHIFDQEILELVEQGIKNAQLSYISAEEILKHLLSSERYEIVYAACELICKHPFVFSEVPEVSLRILMERGGVYEPLALQTLGTWGNHSLFQEVIYGDSWSLESKRIACSFSTLTSQLMDTLVQYLNDYPTYSTDWLGILLNGAHQGEFSSKKRIGDILNHYFEYEFISAKQLTQLIPEQSKEYLFNLSSQTSPHFLNKKIKLFQALNTSYTRKALVTILIETKDKSHLRVILKTVADLKIKEAELYIFPLIQDHPDISFDALKYIGGRKTVNHLKQLLEFDAPIKYNIPSFEKEALTLLSYLVSDPQIIISYLQKHKLPLANLANLELNRPTLNEQFLLRTLDENEINDVIYGIKKLGEFGSLTTLVPIVGKIGMMHTHAQFPNPAWEAALKITQRAYDQHQLRTKNNNRKTAINIALSEAILTQFQKPMSEVNTIIYLNHLSEVISSELPIDKLSVLASFPNPHVTKFYITFLGKSNDRSSIKYLKNYLNHDQDIYTLRQALLALTALKNTALEDLVVPLLSHRNMNIKKTVADYLSEHGTVKAVSAMVLLFKQNDNRGLREKLKLGLQNILNEAYLFFLLNECFPTEIAWQRELIRTSFTNESSLKEHHYISFPELRTIIPAGATSRNSNNNVSFIKNWKKIRKKTKESLSSLTEKDKLVDKVEEIHSVAKNIFVIDLIAPTFRKFKKIPIGTNFKTILTTEEAHFALTSFDHNPYFWECILLDSDSELTAYNNLTKYREAEKKELLFFHFLSHYGIEKLFNRLFKDEEITFLIKLLEGSEIVNEKYFDLYLHFFNVLQKQGQNKILSLTLEKILLKNHLVNKEQQAIIFYNASTIEQKIIRLSTYSSQQQSLLKEEILHLYRQCSWKQRNELLETIKVPENHSALIELSFTHYLNGEKLPALRRMTVDSVYIQQIEKHPDSIELTKDRTYYLPFHSDEFILTYVKEIYALQGANPDLLHSFRQLSTERKWKILKTELEQENWYWLALFDGFGAINTAFKTLFQKVSIDGKSQLVKNYLNQGRLFHFPTLEDLLIPFTKECNDPIPAWLLLFNLRLNEHEQEKVILEFMTQYKKYSSSLRAEILTQFVNHSIPQILIDQNVLPQIIPSSEKESILILQIKLKLFDNRDSNDLGEIIQWIKELVKLDINLAKEAIIDIVIANGESGLAKQMKFLSACYDITELDETITTQISNIFSVELLALTFLNDKHKKLFYKQIEELIKTNYIEIDKKGLLKNMVNDSPDKSKPILLNILTSQKKTDLDALCFRLLKKSTTKEVYLEICHYLLSTNKESLFPSVMRTLSFAGHKASIPILIKLLNHKKRKISKIARESLLVLGSASIPLLMKEVSKTRPDKRSELSELLKEIKNQSILPVSN